MNVPPHSDPFNILHNPAHPGMRASSRCFPAPPPNTQQPGFASWGPPRSSGYAHTFPPYPPPPHPPPQAQQQRYRTQHVPPFFPAMGMPSFSNPLPTTGNNRPFDPNMNANMLARLYQMIGAEFAKMNGRLDRIHAQIGRLRDDVDDIRQYQGQRYEEEQRGRPRTRAGDWMDGDGFPKNPGEDDWHVEEVFDEDIGCAESAGGQGQSGMWGYGGAREEQYGDEIRREWDDVQSNLHSGNGNVGAGPANNGWGTGTGNGYGTRADRGDGSGNGGGWNPSFRFGNDGAGDYWDGEHNSVAAGVIESVKDEDDNNWLGAKDATEHDVKQDEKNQDAQSVESVIEENAGDHQSEDKQDAGIDDNQTAGSVKDNGDNNCKIEGGSIAPLVSHSPGIVVYEKAVSSPATGKADTIRDDTPRPKSVNVEALKGDLTYAIGECAGMLKTFGRIVAQPGGVESPTFDRAGRDLYRALRELESSMDAIRRAKRHTN